MVNGSVRRENPFGLNVGYVRNTLASRIEFAQDPDIPMSLRVVYAAEGEVNRDGHAQFSPGGLAFMLGHKDKASGLWVPALPSTVTKAIRKAKDKGWIDPDSRTRCIVLSATRTSQGRGGHGCRVHRLLTPAPNG